METHRLTLERGHFFVTLAEGRFLLDTGAPSSFGTRPSVLLDEDVFELPSSYMGLTAEVLTSYVGCQADGILGGDILNHFDILIEAPQSRVCFSKSDLQCDGTPLALEDFMGVPVVTAVIDGQSSRMFFDTGAQISYYQGASLASYPDMGSVVDFYPGVGQFSTDTYRIPVQLGASQHELRCGRLPGLLGATLMLAGTEGIIGGQILLGHTAGYFPRRHQLFLA